MQNKTLQQEFETRVRENERLLFKVCRMYANTAANRQDLFQEIVIQLWKAYPKFRGDSSFATWLYRVAINTAISGLRKEKNFIDSYEPHRLPAHAGAMPLNEAEDEQLQQLQIAINRLNMIEKAIIMLYLEDKTYEEMEAILGISQGTLRVKMSRIKEKLRQLTNNN